jgi:hypothetical protein
MIAQVKMPLDDTAVDAKKYDEQKGGIYVYMLSSIPSHSIPSFCFFFLEIIDICSYDFLWIEVGGFGSVGKIEVTLKITHDGEVNRFVFRMLGCIYLVCWIF